MRQSTPPRITQRIDDTKLVPLKGSTLAAVRAASDRGKVAEVSRSSACNSCCSAALSRNRPCACCSISSRTKRRRIITNGSLRNSSAKNSAQPESDVQAVASWLEAKGFRVTNITKGRTAIEFSGDAGTVSKAFHTEIHNYFVNGQAHIANAGRFANSRGAFARGRRNRLTAQFLSQAAVSAQRTLRATIVHKDGTPIRSITLSDGSHALGPDDYATIYNIQPLYAANVTGAGRTIAVLGVTDIVDSDVANFDAVFGLPGSNYTVVHNGSDPGIVDSGDQFESTLDNEWAGATGRGAQIKFVVSASTTTEFGTDLSAQYVIENNLADVMTVSYGACEVQYNAAGAQFEQDIAEQAAAQGITYMASTGDAGAEGCDSPNFETMANGPITVNLPAATPFTLAVGGTEFDEGTGTFWNPTNNSSAGSALSYITEDIWNESCAEGAPSCTSPNIAAGSRRRERALWPADVAAGNRSAARARESTRPRSTRCFAKRVGTRCLLYLLRRKLPEHSGSRRGAGFRNVSFDTFVCRDHVAGGSGNKFAAGAGELRALQTRRGRNFVLVQCLESERVAGIELHLQRRHHRK